MNSKNINIELSLLQLVYLTQSMNIKTMPVSPLAFFNISEEYDNSDDTIKQLKELNLLKPDNTPSEEIAQLFKQLSTVTNAVKIMTVGTPPLLNIAIYPVEDTYTLFMQETTDSFRIISDVKLENITDILESFFGTGSMAFSDLNIHNSIENTLIFTALVDIRRRQILYGILNNTELTPGMIHKNRIYKVIDSDEPNLQWLTSITRETLDVKDEIKKESIDQKLSELKELENYIAEENGAFMPLAAVEVTASRFLLIENIITCEVYSIDEDTLNSTQFDIVKSGFSDLMLIDKAPERKARVFAITQNQAVKIISDLIQDPSQLKNAENLTPQNTGSGEEEKKADSPKTIKCPKCSSEIPANVKFCPECGTSMQKEKPKIQQVSIKTTVKCPKCKTVKAKPQDKFCRCCGHKFEE